METFSALLSFCKGNLPITGGFPSQRSETRSFNVLFDLRLNKPLSKQSRRQWSETPLRSLWLWRQCNNAVKLRYNKSYINHNIPTIPNLPWLQDCKMTILLQKHGDQIYLNAAKSILVDRILLFMDDSHQRISTPYQIVRARTLAEDNVTMLVTHVSMTSQYRVKICPMRQWPIEP